MVVTVTVIVTRTAALEVDTGDYDDSRAQISEAVMRPRQAPGSGDFRCSAYSSTCVHPYHLSMSPRISLECKPVD